MCVYVFSVRLNISAGCGGGGGGGAGFMIINKLMIIAPSSGEKF